MMFCLAHEKLEHRFVHDIAKDDSEPLIVAG